jgi:hypothetical protein
VMVVGVVGENLVEDEDEDEDAVSSDGHVGRRGVDVGVFPERVGLGDTTMLRPFVPWVMILCGRWLRLIWKASFSASCLRSTWNVPVSSILVCLMLVRT